MIFEFITSSVAGSCIGGSLLGIVYALLFVYEKKRQYAPGSSYSQKAMIYSSVSSSLVRALIIGGGMVGMIRIFSLLPGIVVGSFCITFLVVIPIINMSIYEH